MVISINSVQVTKGPLGGLKILTSALTVKKSLRPMRRWLLEQRHAHPVHKDSSLMNHFAKALGKKENEAGTSTNKRGSGAARSACS